MDDLVFFGAMVFLGVLKHSVEEEVCRNDQTHRRAVVHALYRERLRVQVHRDARMRERRAAIERLRLASSDPRWQQRIDQILLTMAGG